jgi:cohesin loading factor subunit SCC2
MQTLRMGLEAAAILLFIINSPGIDRRVVNEDAIEASIVLFRHNLAKNVLPALNNVGHIVAAMSKAEASTPSTSAKKRRRSSAGGGEAAVIRDMKKVYRQILTTVGLTVLVIERLDYLVQKIPLDDQQLLTISSGALVCLELDATNESSVKTCHQLHVASIGIITSIFRKYPRHRTIIVEDLFPVMLKMPTSKRSMRTYPVHCSSVLYPSGLVKLSRSLVPANQDPQFIQTISAIIMAFVQSSVQRPTFEVPRNQDEPVLMTTAPQVTPQVVSGLRECQEISDMFVQQLLQRCSKKGEDGGASEFRPILSNLIDDLLLVLLVPEYPAAEMMLLSIANMISRDLMKATSPKAMQNAENTYLNTAFDALSKICAAEARILKCNREKAVRLRAEVRSANDKHMECYCEKNKFDENTFMLDCDRCHSWQHAGCVGLNRDTVPEQWHCDSCQLGRIAEFERDRNTNMGELGCSPALVDEPYCMRRLLIDYLSIVSRKSGVVGIQDAYEFHLARWLSELNPRGKGGNALNGGLAQAKPNTMPLITRLMELWDPRESSDINMLSRTSLNGMLHCISDEGRSRMVVHLSSTQSNLLVSHRSQIGLFVKLMDSESSALLRKLAVKAIERVRICSMLYFYLAAPLIMSCPFFNLDHGC